MTFDFSFVTYSDPNNIDRVLASCPHSLDGRTIDPKACNPRSLQKPKRNTFLPKVQTFASGTLITCIFFTHKIPFILLPYIPSLLSKQTIQYPRFMPEPSILAFLVPIMPALACSFVCQTNFQMASKLPQKLIRPLNIASAENKNSIQIKKKSFPGIFGWTSFQHHGN